MMKKVIAFIQKIYKFISFVFRKVFTKKRIKHQDQLLTMDQLINNDYENISALSDEQKNKINNDVKKMIEYYNQRTDQIELRRGRLVEASWQTLTILIAATGLLIASKLSLIIRGPILIIFIIQIIFALLKLIEFQAQSSYNYPFNMSSFGNTWKWFYYGNPKFTHINLSPFQSVKSNRKNIIPYLDGFHYFLEKFRKESINTELIDNLQQLYLLQVHNGYKNQFYLRIYKYDKWANRITFTLISMTLGVLIGYWIHLNVCL